MGEIAIVSSVPPRKLPDLVHATLFVIREPRVAREPRASEDAP
jgi:hypothetical protein